jgi:hypothetical protein
MTNRPIVIECFIFATEKFNWFSIFRIEQKYYEFFFKSRENSTRLKIDQQLVV